MTATGQRHRRRQAGFAPPPCAGKRPVLDEWQKRTDASPDDIEPWATMFPHADNTDILTRLALDIDILDTDAVEAVEQLAHTTRTRLSVVLWCRRSPPDHGRTG